MAWDPAQYNRFAAEREQPFWDLASLLQPVDAPVMVDLGCGDGRLTAALSQQLGAKSVTGIDSSPAMLAEARAQAGPALRFEQADIGAWSGEGFDIVLSNAALQWVPDHAGVLARWSAALAPGGQLAVQMPTNADHPSHQVARALGAELLGDDAPPDSVAANVLAPEAYARLLDEIGFTHQHVRLQVYPHHLATTGDVVEWVKGTSLTRFAAVLDEKAYADFLGEYRRRLLAELGDRAPYLYTFKRILLWGRRA